MRRVPEETILLINLRADRHGELRVAAERSGVRVLDETEPEPARMVAVEIETPGPQGIEMVRRARREHRNAEIFVLSPEPSDSDAAALCDVGADTVLHLPADSSLLATKLFDRPDHPASLEGALDALSPTQTPVLLWGEDGLANERAARILHARSPRSESPFVHIECAAATMESLRAELLVGNRTSRLALAPRWTYYLDDVSTLELETQALLLRVLLSRDSAEVVASTTRDLRQAVARLEFRPDLYFRLRHGLIVMPMIGSPVRSFAW